MTVDPPTGASLLRPAFITTLFPLLPPGLRNAFRLALLGLTLLMLGVAVMGWQAPLIGIVALGLPVLFVAYLHASNAVAALPYGTVTVTAALGVGLGIAWALGTEAAIAREGDDVLGLPVGVTRVVITGLAIPLSFVLCLLAPAVLMRLRRSRRWGSLGGFMIGALGGYCFVAAVTLTQLAPEFAAAPDPDAGRSTSGLVLAAAIQGLAIPLTAAALAGAVGATLWFRAGDDAGRRARWYAPTSPTPWIAVAIVAFLVLEALDDLSVPDGLAATVCALVTVLSLYALRVALRSTLNHEAYEGGPEARSRSAVGLLLAMAVALALVAGASVALSVWLAPVLPNYVCPPDCGRPPIGTPVATNPRFTPDGGEFSVPYPGPGTAYEASFEPNGVVLDLLAGDGGTLRLFGQPAEGRTPKEIAKDLIGEHYPDAETDYEIPNASVGYQLGYGEVADDYPSDSIADESRNRVLVMVAVKNDYALVAAAAGPFREFSPSFGSGHPSGANFFLALDMGKYVNGFRWRGDPPR